LILHVYVLRSRLLCTRLVTTRLHYGYGYRLRARSRLRSVTLLVVGFATALLRTFTRTHRVGLFTRLLPFVGYHYSSHVAFTVLIYVGLHTRDTHVLRFTYIPFTRLDTHVLLHLVTVTLRLILRLFSFYHTDLPHVTITVHTTRFRCSTVDQLQFCYVHAHCSGYCTYVGYRLPRLRLRSLRCGYGLRCCVTFCGYVTARTRGYAVAVTHGYGYGWLVGYTRLLIWLRLPVGWLVTRLRFVTRSATRLVGYAFAHTRYPRLRLPHFHGSYLCGLPLPLVRYIARLLHTVLRSGLPVGLVGLLHTTAVTTPCLCG